MTHLLPVLLQKRLHDQCGQFQLVQHQQKEQLLQLDAQPQVSVQRDVASAVPAAAVIAEQRSLAESVERRGQSLSAFFFRRGGLLAAASLFSAEAEELEPTSVFEDEVGCMGLIFWLSGVLM